MIEPFEYENTKSQVNLRDSTVKNDRLDASALDAPLRKLNHFKQKAEHQSFQETQHPFTQSFQKEVGRVRDGDRHKSHFQDEAIASRGSLVSGYDVLHQNNVMERENASVLISKYLDGQVQYVPPMMEVVKSVENIKSSDPVLQPGITFIDSRKNMATSLQ